MFEFKIFLTNLGKYNDGDLVGEWLDLPLSDEELKKAFIRIGIDGVKYEEYFITDYENTFGIKVGEYDNLEELNELAELILSLDENDNIIFKALKERDNGLSDIEALESIKDFYVDTELLTNIDIANNYIENMNTDGIPEIILNNIDLESLGKDVLLGSINFMSTFGLLIEF